MALFCRKWFQVHYWRTIASMQLKPVLCRHHIHANSGSVVKQHNEVVEKIRNIGVMAHIDAGKTTTTERMLYYSGLISHLGNVDDGDTVTDYMEQERDRGITITSAAVTFPWRKHKINLIDTPGHVDFTLEVERCLRVLDGVITVIDSSAGVEAQTLTVWRQAKNYEIPAIFFMNKMDKQNADFPGSVASISKKLGLQPLVIQIPVGSGKEFTGLIDLLSMKIFMWNKKSDEFNCSALSEDHVLYEQAMNARCKLVETLADYDEEIGDHVLNDLPHTDLTASRLVKTIRTLTLNNTLVPVLCGSAAKNTGIQMLMDAITLYLPHPDERSQQFTSYYAPDLCALAFKIVQDKQRGLLTFLRLYSGQLKVGQSVYNGNQGTSEKVARLLQIQANEWKEIKSVSTGNIVAVTGLHQTVTGDMLMTSHSNLTRAMKKYKAEHNITDSAEHNSTDSVETVDVEQQHSQYAPVLGNISVPQPVFFRSIEPPSLAYQKKLDQALQNLTREDPSLSVRIDSETGQTIVSGMGELHLEIMQDRILKEYGVDAYMGPLQIAYREFIQASHTSDHTLHQVLSNQNHKVYVKLSVQPMSGVGMKPVKHLDIDGDDGRLVHGITNRAHNKAVINGINAGLQRGPLLGSTVVDTHVILHDLVVSHGTSVPMVTACVAHCVHQTLQQAAPGLMQPYMAIQITVPEDRVNNVLSDLSHRHSSIDNVERPTQSGVDKECVIHARTPLAQLVGYSNTLRTMTSGTASFSMQLSDYEKMDSIQQQKAINNVHGFS